MRDARPPMHEHPTPADETVTPDRPEAAHESDTLTQASDLPRQIYAQAHAQAETTDAIAAPLARPVAEQLAAWRDGGVDKRDPVRFHRIEALSLRMHAYDGDVRRVLETRLGRLTAELAKSFDGPPPSSVTREARASDAASPLVALTTEIAQRVGVREFPTPSAAPTTTARAPAHAAPGAAVSPKRPVAPTAPAPVAITPTVIATDDAFEDLDVLEYFRETWSKLSTDGNLRQSLAQVPENAGPLNSSHLVHRALSLMHDVSPDYLRHFLRHADALSWLEDMETTGVFGNKSAARRSERQADAREGALKRSGRDALRIARRLA
ncbi:hypothetical protein PAN31108_04012 [Pandoraea anhela]|uniref:DUF2894 domain-containing protein n=2 Tax=Pandoraea anhela TaxID=2508295 RepID=A0A5E4XPX3_9BURK|nr:hypothetical protein PAN31108_04012 [Pandoraea anhela]